MLLPLPLPLALPEAPWLEEREAAGVVEGLVAAPLVWLPVAVEVTTTVVGEVAVTTEVEVATSGPSEVEEVDSAVVSAVLSVVGVALAEGVQQERYDLLVARVSVPVYIGHPGTSVLGGARPPPQSRGSQISPVSGSNQWTILSAQVVKLWVEQSTAATLEASISRGRAVATVWTRIVATEWMSK